MRIRKLVLVAAAATLPLGLTSCGGASVEDFCEQYEAIDQLEESDADQAKGLFEDLSENVPDEAGDDVKEAADYLAENFPSDGDIEAAVESGDMGTDDAQEFASAADTVSSYGDENCGS
ncbi:hypothetical protein GCU60_03665 [Blastococcus saxobsidens]|uniref:Lipoprotein n=1 Tax=Blastococcus saxobsidens TaxID=138336 RepID=A0A6L9VYK9_9ACTN|nr:hypothetical protein [Blastococcus saxobsidens]NEK84866.1 hypothetical protein [Blastococcus saxobsidens]